MYRYKLLNNDEFTMAYKKYIRKNLLKGSLIPISIINLMMLIFSYLYFVIDYKTNIISFLSISSMILILEFLIFFISYKNECKNLLNNIPNDEANISFDEEGIYLEHYNTLRHIKWQAVKKVIVDDNNMILLYKVTGISGNFFYLKFFDVEGEELIKDIEKYIKVRRCS